MKDFRLFPYKIQVTHMVLFANLEKRLQNCDVLLNIENHQFWSCSNQQLIHQQPLQELKGRAWFGVKVENKIGPHRFEDDQKTVLGCFI